MYKAYNLRLGLSSKYDYLRSTHYDTLFLVSWRIKYTQNLLIPNFISLLLF